MPESLQTVNLLLSRVVATTLQRTRRIGIESCLTTHTQENQNLRRCNQFPSKKCNWNCLVTVTNRNNVWLGDSIFVAEKTRTKEEDGEKWNRQSTWLYTSNWFKVLHILSDIYRLFRRCFIGWSHRRNVFSFTREQYCDWRRNKKLNSTVTLRMCRVEMKVCGLVNFRFYFFRLEFLNLKLNALACAPSGIIAQVWHKCELNVTSCHSSKEKMTRAG